MDREFFVFDLNSLRPLRLCGKNGLGLSWVPAIAGFQLWAGREDADCGMRDKSVAPPGLPASTINPDSSSINFSGPAKAKNIFLLFNNKAI
jgi:hypothetical protein